MFQYRLLKPQIDMTQIDKTQGNLRQHVTRRGIISQTFPFSLVLKESLMQDDNLPDGQCQKEAS